MSETVPNPFNNPEFRAELSDMFDDKLNPIIDVQREQHKILARHERDISRGKGAVAVISALFGLITAYVKRWI